MLIPLDTYPETQDHPRLALTIGVFDGVHVGHQELIRQTVTVSQQAGSLLPAALTFDPHPATFLAPQTAPPLLCTFDERVRLLTSAGIERVISARFDRNFAQEPAADFVGRVLVEHLKVGAVIVGDDFHYGRDRLGDNETLRHAGDRYGFQVVSVPQVYVHDVPARSTEIRRHVASGEVEEAKELLGRPFALSGTVVHGQQLGRTLGFPTANLMWHPNIVVPDSGVYAGWATVGGRSFRAAISVGNNPTVAPEGTTFPRTVEAYLLDDFASDIYGKDMCLEFTSRLRGMEKFSDLNELVHQMHEDVREVLSRLS